MKPATVAELRAAVEGKYHCIPIARKYQGDCFVMCAIPLLCVVSRVLTRMDVNLKTGADKTIK